MNKVKANRFYARRTIDTRGPILTAEHGAGAIGTVFAPRTYRWDENGHIITEIHIDMTGLLAKGTAAKDAIGLTGAALCHIGRYVTATYGICYRIEMICLEIPTKTSGSTTVGIGIAGEFFRWRGYCCWIFRDSFCCCW